MIILLVLSALHYTKENLQFLSKEKEELKKLFLIM